MTAAAEHSIRTILVSLLGPLLAPIFCRLALHRRCCRVLELEPVTPAAADVWRAESLRHEAPLEALWRTVSPNASFPIHPHMLRHGCGYALAKAGQDTRALQAWLGHRNIQHTVRYTELAPDRFKNFWR
jgi:integrase